MSVAELLAANYSIAETHAWSFLAVALVVRVTGSAMACLGGPLYLAERRRQRNSRAVPEESQA